MATEEKWPYFLETQVNVSDECLVFTFLAPLLPCIQEGTEQSGLKKV